MHYGVPVMRYHSYMASGNNHHDMRRARQSLKLLACNSDVSVCYNHEYTPALTMLSINKIIIITYSFVWHNVNEQRSLYTVAIVSHISRNA